MTSPVTFSLIHKKKVYYDYEMVYYETVRGNRTEITVPGSSGMSHTLRHKIP